MSSCWAIVPALDEEATIGDVVRATSSWVDGVIVVDDGSSDDTAARAAQAGAVVISHPSNRGVGAAIATGLTAARERGADLVVQVDGDDQHDPASIPDLLAAARSGTDLVVGTRFELGFEMGGLRRLVLRAISQLVSIRIGVRVSDPTSGFRVFGADAADALAPEFPTRYLADTVEVLYMAHEHGLTIAAVPVRMRQRVHGSASVGPVRGAMYTVRILLIVARHSLSRRPR